MRQIILVLAFASILHPQDIPSVDTVVLLDGSTIKGTLIVVIPNEHIKISTVGGSILTIDMAEVLKIKRGLVESTSNVQSKIQSNSKHHYYEANIKFYKYGWATTAGITLLGSAAMGDESFATTVIPVVGPFMTISQIENDPNLYYLPGAKNMLLASGLLQASFFSLWIMYELLDLSLPSNYAIAILPQSEAVGLSVAYKF